MELRCPDCCSRDIGSSDQVSGDVFRCRNCAASFHRTSGLVTVGEADSLTRAPSPRAFRFNRQRLDYLIRQADDVTPLSSGFSDSDELCHLAVYAQKVGVISCTHAGSKLVICPASIAEPKPLIAVTAANGHTIVGPEMTLRHRSNEDPISFTARLLEQITHSANELIGDRFADTHRLDRIAAVLLQSDSDGADCLDAIRHEVTASGRRVFGETTGSDSSDSSQRRAEG
jgi:hypothetical protein